MPATSASQLEEGLEARIIRVVSDLTGVPSTELRPDTRIREDLRADSMQVMALMIALDAEFDVEFDVSSIPEEGVTIAWIRDFVAASLAGAA